MIAPSDQDRKIQHKNIFRIKIQYHHANASISYLGCVEGGRGSSGKENLTGYWVWRTIWIVKAEDME